MELKKNINVHNRFDVYVNSKWKGCAENIILNKMYDRLCTGASYFEYIFFGTGNGTPTSDRTSLFNHLGAKSAVTEEVIKATPVSSWKRKIILNPEEYVGETISEVGIGYTNWETALVTHAMLKDAEGQPIVITKTDTDVVIIFATVYFTFSNPNSGVTLRGLPDDNILLNYLTGDEFPSISFDLKPSNLAKDVLGTISGNIFDDIPNRQRVISGRFDILTGNGNVKCLSVDRLFDLPLPAVGIYSGQSLQGVSIGTGDGVRSTFKTPSDNVKLSSIVVKKNGSTISDISKNMVNTKRNFTYESFRRFLQLWGSTKYIECCNFFNTSDDVILMLGVYHTSPEPASSFIVLKYHENYGYEVHPIQPKINFGWDDISDRSIIKISNDDLSFAFTLPWKEPEPIPNHKGIGFFDLINSEWVFREGCTLPYNVYSWDITPSFDVLAAAEKGQYGPKGVHVYDIINNSQLVERPFIEELQSARICKITDDGNTLIGIFSEAPIIFDWDGTQWIKRLNIISPYSCSYDSLDISFDGKVIACEINSGSVYAVVFEEVDGVYQVRPPLNLSVSTKIEDAVTLSNDGRLLAIRLANAPFIKIFEWTGTAWDVKDDDPYLTNKGYTEININKDMNKIMTLPDISNRSEVYMFDYSKRETEVTFTTPPEQDALITADYTVEGLHKTDQYVVDVGCTIKFNEGV